MMLFPIRIGYSPCMIKFSLLHQLDVFIWFAFLILQGLLTDRWILVIQIIPVSIAVQCFCMKSALQFSHYLPTVQLLTKHIFEQHNQLYSRVSSPHCKPSAVNITLGTVQVRGNGYSKQPLHEKKTQNVVVI